MVCFLEERIKKECRAAGKSAYSYLFFMFGLCMSFCVSQSGNADSLGSLVSRSKPDTNKVKLLNQFCQQYRNTQPAEFLRLAAEALRLAEKLKYKRGIAGSLANVGNAYYEKADYDSALFYHLKSLRVKEELGDSAGVALCYNNIGNTYKRLGDTDLALDYFSKAKVILETHGNKRDLALTLTNIGTICRRKKEFAKALSNYETALKIMEQLGDKAGQSPILNNIGGVYIDKQDPVNALAFQNRSLRIKQELNDQRGIAVAYTNISATYFLMKKNALSAEAAEKALSFARTLGFKDLIREIYGGMSERAAKLGDFENAYKAHLKYTEIKDSLISEAGKKQVTEMQEKYQSEKKDLELAKKSAFIKSQELESRQKSVQRNFFILGFTLMCGLVFFVFRSYRIKNKANIRILRQKEIIEEKQKEILDSIYYARRIQRALITNERYITRHLRRLTTREKTG
jgi:tetratricopeptide (TPR) repeat protein